MPGPNNHQPIEADSILSNYARIKAQEYNVPTQDVMDILEMVEHQKKLTKTYLEKGKREVKITQSAL
ncbi:MAG: hypothetical protein JST70_13425 [Bacteroidetes bacterium]|nr:hypothetical protein [Bacteroidota bacterium]